MNLLPISLTIAAMAFAAADSTPIDRAYNVSSNTVVITPFLSKVVKVVDKYFFADNTKRTWTDSKKYCESLGMELASVTNDELTELKKVYSDSFAGNYFTNAQTGQAIANFKWSDNAVVDSSFNFDPTGVDSKPACLIYHSGRAGGSFFYANICDTNVGVLCHLKN